MQKDAGEIQEGKKKKAEASLCERDILFGHDQPLQLALLGHGQSLQPASVWIQPAFQRLFLDTASSSAGSVWTPPALQPALFGHDQPLQPASVWTQPALKLALFGHSQPVPIPAGRGCARGEFLLPHVLRPLWNAAWQAVSG